MTSFIIIFYYNFNKTFPCRPMYVSILKFALSSKCNQQLRFANFTFVSKLTY